jgi:hypothetical protein
MIMNPMTRKMFKSRDARTKLRGMGGILASSPELSQTVQEFQAGGVVFDPGLRLSGQPLMARPMAPFQTPAMGGLTPGLTQYGGYLEQKYGNPQFEQKKDAFLQGVYQKEQQTFGGIGGFSQPETPSHMIGPGGFGQPLFGGVGRQLFSNGGNVDADFGSNVEYTYSTFLAENNLNDTPQAREMFARYKSLMDTRDPLTDPQLFSSVGFDRAPSALGDAPMTSAVEFDPNREFSQPAVPSSLRRLQRLRAAGLSELSIEPDAAFTPQTSPAAPVAPAEPISTLDQLRSSVYSTGPLEALGQAYGEQAEVFAPYNKAREDQEAFRAVGESFDNNALLSSGRAPSVLDELRGNVYSTGPLEATLAAVGPSLNEAFSREGMPSQTAADVAAEVALRNRERASENAGRLTSEELMSPDPVRPGAAPELTAEELAMQAYGESLGQQYAPIGENAEQVDQAVSEFFEFLGSPKVGSGAVNFPGAEGRAIIRGDLTAAEMMPPPPITPDLPAEERRMDYVPEGETPVVEAPEGETPVVEAPEGETPVVEAPEGETPAPDAETPAPDGDTGTGTLQVDPEKLAPLMPQPGDTDADVRAKYKDRLKLFQEILGEDEAGARNKGMELAMIGLAIMSGQSPNALTNIAQGGAAGLKAMSARDEAARERQRLIRTTALESVLDEEAAATSAAATAAEKELDRANVLEAARIRTSGTATQAAARNLANIADDASKAAGEVYNDPVMQASSDVKRDEKGKPLETESQYRARKALEQQTLAQVMNPAIYGTSPAIKAMVKELLKNNDKSLVRSELLRKYPAINPADYGL